MHKTYILEIKKNFTFFVCIIEPLKDALDGVEKYMTGFTFFQDQAFYNELVACMNVLDPR